MKAAAIRRTQVERPTHPLLQPCECFPLRLAGACIVCKRWQRHYRMLLLRMRAWGVP